MVPELGVDLLGGNNEKQRIQPYSNYQVGIAGRIRKRMKEKRATIALSTVG
jgi:hypothetical protein